MLRLDSKEKFDTLGRYGDPEVSKIGTQQFESDFSEKRSLAKQKSSLSEVIYLR
jgi:hypothetical protein